MSWRVAKSLLHLREQVNAVYPQRKKDWDGTIGDTAHAARTSDHNPDGHGVVRAMDITHDPAHGFDSYKFADELRLYPDKRVRYVISNRRIWNPSISPLWRPYNGSNPHDHHVHISVVSTDLADNEGNWDLPMIRPLFGPRVPPTPEVSTQFHENIVATVFDSVESGQKGFYGEFLSPNDFFVALPYKFVGERPQVRVYGTNAFREAPVKDVGPWNINDPYWLKPGGRPQAESGHDLGQTKWGVRKTNLAGIDLSPALAKAIGIDGKGIVRWEFVDKRFEPKFPSSPPAPPGTPVSVHRSLPVLPGTKSIADVIRAVLGAIFGSKT